MNNYRNKLNKIIFEADTVAGKAFDVTLLVLILLSILTIFIDSVPQFHSKLGDLFITMEWAFTIIFTIEYLIRIWIAKSASKYIFSFYGIIDLLAILPTFIGLFILNTHGLIVLRALRLLRMFRIFKLTRYLNASYIIMDALRRSKAKISVFLFAVIMVVLVIGTLMYMIEGGENGFTSIPRSVYWAIVTLTTVGYGDISPQTALGQFIASIVMILGYAIIAVPTGIVTSELSRNKSVKSIRSCNTCYKTGLDEESTYCKYCGSKLIE